MTIDSDAGHGWPPEGPAFWRAVVQNGYAAPAGASPDALAASLVACLTSTNPEVRDDVGYFALGHWVTRGLLSDETSRTLVRRLTGALTDGLGSVGDDRVFGRSFACAVLAALAGRDARTAFLAPPDTLRLGEAAVAYARGERDVRAFVPPSGWAHAPAHAADLLAALADHSALGAAHLARTLDALAVLLAAPVAYRHGEPRRLAEAAARTLRRQVLPEGVVRAWGEALVDLAGGNDWSAGAAADDGLLNRRHNVTTFLLHLHRLAVLRPDVGEAATATVRAALDALVPG